MLDVKRHGQLGGGCSVRVREPAGAEHLLVEGSPIWWDIFTCCPLLNTTSPSGERFVELIAQLLGNMRMSLLQVPGVLRCASGEVSRTEARDAQTSRGDLHMPRGPNNYIWGLRQIVHISARYRNIDVKRICQTRGGLQVKVRQPAGANQGDPIWRGVSS